MRKYFGVALGAALSIAFAYASVAANLGDYATGTNICGKFPTFRPSTGATFTLAGTPALSVYKDTSTTQSTTGVTLTADFDAVTGLNHFCIDTSADGTFYSAGSNFDVVITTGTVDSVSVTGAVVANFTLNKTAALRPTTAGRTLVVDAAGLADANMVKMGPTGSGTAQTARDIGTSVLISSGTGTGQLSVTSGVVASDPATGSIVNADFACTGGSFLILGVTDCGTAQSATSTSVVLRSAAAFADDVPNGSSLLIQGSTQGYPSSRVFTDYVGSTDTGTVDAFTVTPSGTLTYYLFGTSPASGGSGGSLTASDVWSYGGGRTVSAATNITSSGGTIPITSSRVDASVGAYQSGQAPLQPTTAGRTLDVSATGEAGLDWANIGAPTTTVNLSGTTVAAVSGAVASVTGNVGGNVVGFVGSVNTNGISANSLAADAGTELAAATWANATRTLSSGLNIVLAKGTGVTGFNDIPASDVRTEANGAITDNLLNYVLKDTYNPALPPGASDSLLEQLIENGGGLARFTTGALVNAPAGGGGGGGTGLSVGEIEQLRYQVGIDGIATQPSTGVPHLASAASVAALPTQITTAVRDGVSEDQGNVSRGCIEAILLAYAAGDTTTVGGTTTYKDPSNGEVRITGTVLSAGNRSVTITCPSY